MPDFPGETIDPARPRPGALARGYTILEYPNDVGTYKYTTKISFMKYKRESGRPPTINTESVLVLPLPLNLAQSYGINVSTTEGLGVLGNFNIDTDKIAGRSLGEIIPSAQDLSGSVLSATASIGRALGDIPNFITAVGQEISKTDVNNLLLLSAKIVGNENVQRQIQGNLGRVFNPHLATLFNGVGLRQFQYSWKVSPRSEKEATTLLSIFRHIKQNMHPEIPYTAGGLKAFLAYPNQVTIDFPNLKNYTNVGRSFITSFNINNTPSGVASLYKDGSPVEISFEISVVESEIKTSGDF